MGPTTVTHAIFAVNIPVLFIMSLGTHLPFENIALSILCYDSRHLQLSHTSHLRVCAHGQVLPGCPLTCNGGSLRYY